VTIEINVTAHTEMFDTDELGDMVVMVQDVLNCGRLLGRNEIADASNTHDPTFGCHFSNCFIGLTSRLVGIQRATIGMSDQYGRLGNFEGVERGPVAAMSDIDSHSYLVHSFDDCNSEVAYAVVTPLRAPVAD